MHNQKQTRNCMRIELLVHESTKEIKATRQIKTAYPSDTFAQSMPQVDVNALRNAAGNSSDGIIDDFSESICAICESGGDMICCDGKCLRSFHPSCIGLREEDIPEDSPFVCSDCVNGIQRCFECKHFGIANQLIKCRVPFCGKFYHADCISSTDSDNYVCRLHICDDCGETATLKHEMQSLWRCFRCPKAFDAKHRPRDVHVIADNLFLCIRHIQNDDKSTLPDMSPEVRKYIADKHLARRRQKSVKYISKDEITISHTSSLLLREKLPNNALSSVGFVPLQRMSAVKAAHREPNINNDSNLETSTNPRVVSSSALNIVPRKRRSDEAPTNEDNNYIKADNNDNAAKSDVEGTSVMQYDRELYNHNNKKQRYVRPMTTSLSSSNYLRRHNEMRRRNRQQWRNIANDDRYYDQWYSSMNYYSSYVPTNDAMSRTTALLSQPGYYEDYDEATTYYAEAYFNDRSTSLYAGHSEVIDVRDLPSYGEDLAHQRDAAPVLSRTAKLLSAVSEPSVAFASSGTLSRTEQLLKAVETPPAKTTCSHSESISTSARYGFQEKHISTGGKMSANFNKNQQASASPNKPAVSTKKSQKDNKMNALDLMAMLQANKLIALPSKK